MSLEQGLAGISGRDRMVDNLVFAGPYKVTVFFVRLFGGCLV